MTIALMAHDSRKELMMQFCTAYCGLLAKYKLVATAITGKMVSEATGLQVHCFMGGASGSQQIVSRVACDEIDMVLCFRDALHGSERDEQIVSLLRMCDMHNIPIATNIATAEVLIHGLERGDLAWRDILHSQLD